MITNNIESSYDLNENCDRLRVERTHVKLVSNNMFKTIFFGRHDDHDHSIQVDNPTAVAPYQLYLGLRLTRIMQTRSVKCFVITEGLQREKD